MFTSRNIVLFIPTDLLNSKLSLFRLRSVQPKSSIKWVEVMNKIALTLLCGSSVFALTLLNVHPAFAKKFSPQDLANPNSQPTGTQTLNAPISQQEDPLSSPMTFNEKVKQLALQQFGCTCANCQATARQMLLQGSLPH
jgi:hypothetical protein